MDEHNAAPEGPEPQLRLSPPPDATTRADPPPGWYLDPTNLVALRFWDGASWTAHTSPIPPPTSAPVDVGSKTASLAAMTPDMELAAAVAAEATQVAEHAAQAAVAAVAAAREAALAAKEAALAAETQTRVAEDATQVAANAAQVAQQIDQAVSMALATNTPASWRAAAQLAVTLGVRATDEPKP